MSENLFLNEGGTIRHLMTSESPFRTSDIPTQDEIDRLLIEGVAQMRATEISEVEQQFIESGGDLEMDTQEAVPVIAHVENVLKRTLPGIENLKPGQPISIRALSILIQTKLHETPRKS